MKNLSQLKRRIIFSAIWLALLAILLVAAIMYPNAPVYIWVMLCLCLLIVAILGLVFSRKDLEISFVGSTVVALVRKVLGSKKVIAAGGIVGVGKAFMQKPSKYTASTEYDYEKLDLGGLPLERITYKASQNKNKVILQLHGGAFVLPFSDTYRRATERLIRLSYGAVVVSIDYRIGGENKHPAALEDALTAWKWLLSEGYKPKDIAVIGDSAGGNLALTLTHKLIELEMETPNCIICMSPWTDLLSEGDSYKDNAYIDPMFGVRKGQTYEQCERQLNEIKFEYFDRDADLSDKFISPINGSFSGFPPMLVQCGGAEILLSDSVTLAERAKACGVPVAFSVYKGMFHIFQMFGSLFLESKIAWFEAEVFLKKCLYNKDIK